MSFDILKLGAAKKAWEYRSEPEAIRTLATVFWRTLLMLGFALLLVALWFGSQELSAASQAENVAPVSAAAAPPWTPSQLQQAVDELSSKQQSYQTTSGAPLPGVADPSK